jgi:hypothetical protein
MTQMGLKRAQKRPSVSTTVSEMVPMKEMNKEQEKYLEPNWVPLKACPMASTTEQSAH